MKSSEILREAARLVGEDRYLPACFAINKAVLGHEGCGVHTEQRKAFADMFMPRDNEWKGAFHLRWLEQYDDDSEADAQHRRIVALCLAAAIAESEGD